MSIEEICKKYGIENYTINDDGSIDFYCFNNPIGSIFNKADIDFIRAFNTFKVLNDGIVNFKRLKYVMEMFDKPINIEEIKKHYTIK